MKLEDLLQQYIGSPDYPFHMPGHKRMLTGLLEGTAAFDITEIPGFDDLHDPQGVLREEMERAAAFYGTRATLFSVNGSTAANLSAISAAVPEGATVLIADNCHRSVFHAAMLRHLRVVLLGTGAACRAEEAISGCRIIAVISPDMSCLRSELRDGGAVSAKMVEEALAEFPDAGAVIITSPTYDGIVSDVAAIVRSAHGCGSVQAGGPQDELEPENAQARVQENRGPVVIVDEAHGAHFSMHPYFPVSAVKQGADLVIQSLHKTLPSLTQTALLHNVTGRVRTEELFAFMDVYETSSPSYVLMASIASCVHFLMEARGAEEGPFDRYAGMLAGLRAELGKMRHFQLLPNDDPSKLLIGTQGSGTDGPALAKVLRTEYHLVAELVMPSYVLCMTSVRDTEEGFRRLADAMRALDENGTE